MQQIRRYFTFDQDIVRRVMLLLFLSLPVLVLVGRSVLDIAISVIAGAFLVFSLYWRDFDWLKVRWVQVALLFCLFMICNSFFAADHVHALKNALPYVRFPVFAAAVSYWLIRERRELEWFFIILVGASVFVAANGLFEFMTGYDFSGNPQQGAYLSGPFEMSKVGTYLVKFGIPALLGFVAILLHWGWSRFTASRVGVALFIVFAVTVLLSGERMAALLLFFFLFLVFLTLAPMRKLILGSGIAFVGLAAVIFIANPSLKSRYIDTTLRDIGHHQVANRFNYKEIWILSLEMFKDRPLFGVGNKNYQRVCMDKAYEPLLLGGPNCKLHPHNIYLELLVDTGLVGSLLFLTMVFFWGREIFQAGLPDEGRLILLSGLISVIIILWPLATGMSIFSNFYGGMAWMMMAVMLASYQIFTQRPYGYIVRRP